MDITTKEILLPWLCYLCAFSTIGILWILCSLIFFDRKYNFSLFLFFVASFVFYSSSVVLKSDIYDFSRENTFRYMYFTDSDSWSLDNKYAKIFKVDGKNFLKLNGYKYEVETTSEGGIFIHTMDGCLAYAITNKGEIIEF